MCTGRIFFGLALFISSQSEELFGAHSDTADIISDLSRRLENLEYLRTKDTLEAQRREEELLSRIQATEDNERRIRDLEQLTSGQFHEIASLKNHLEHLSRGDVVSAEKNPGNSSYSQLDRLSRAGVHFPPVAFYAYSSTTLRYLTRRMLPYDTVITNVGNGYNKYTGAFTCSVPGVYFFTWDIYVGGGVGYHVDTELQRNGQAVAFAKAGTTTYLAMTGSSSAILQLVAGDTVWVKVSEETNDQTVLYNNKTKFSGFLIQ
ncbi:complement C1q-like protein 4 [Mizuhopecten yessoensis]|uniref:Complement C1q-like protein 3 n=1 Tax=Mizuhopecten yessoensis TaxID=6573 RepID=A0A210QIY1_MIZYE|nr:complement C1q-like protein 4 [Mizuhopecten yessoensis]OWF48700.1 Complement C1q-like protein 3 [Mizuhopecten yessoensis]